MENIKACVYLYSNELKKRIEDKQEHWKQIKLKNRK